jgi:hypothetical protein
VGDLYDAVRERLSRTGLSLTEHEADGWLELRGFGRAGTWRLVADVHEDKGTVVVFSIASQAVPAERREGVAWLAHRVNYGLLVGGFELDLDTGELRFRTSLTVSSRGLDVEQLQDVVGFNLSTMDRYLPLFDAVVAGTDPSELWSLAG